MCRPTAGRSGGARDSGPRGSSRTSPCSPAPAGTPGPSSTKWRAGSASWRARGRVSPGAMAVAERPGDAGALSRLGLLQHQLEERDGWRLEQKVEMVVSRLSLPADRRPRAVGGWQRRTLLGRALVSSPICCSSMSRPTTWTSTPSAGWRTRCARFPSRSSSSLTIARFLRRSPPASSSSIAAR